MRESSEYFKRQCYIALDVDEEPAVDVVDKMGADYFVVSTDDPHSDGACARLYNIDTPAAALTKGANGTSAA